MEGWREEEREKNLTRHFKAAEKLAGPAKNLEKSWQNCSCNGWHQDVRVTTSTLLFDRDSWVHSNPSVFYLALAIGLHVLKNSF
jgi:hypothetical protein